MQGTQFLNLLTSPDFSVYPGPGRACALVREPSVLQSALIPGIFTADTPISFTFLLFFLCICHDPLSSPQESCFPQRRQVGYPSQVRIAPFRVGESVSSHRFLLCYYRLVPFWGTTFQTDTRTFILKPGLHFSSIRNPSVSESISFCRHNSS